MDEDKRKQHAPEENEPSRLTPERTEEVEHTKEDARARHRNGGESEYYMWGLVWSQFVGVVISSIGIVITAIVASLNWRVATTSQAHTQQKERARIVLSEMWRDTDLPLSFSLTFKNVGETTALGAYGVWLRGECQYTSLQDCINWCVQPLRETKGEGYGPLIRQAEHKEEFFYTLKTGKARKKQRPVYFCGYFAYTDVYCMWRRQFYAVSYDPATDQLSPHTVSENNEEAQRQDCRP